MTGADDSGAAERATADRSRYHRVGSVSAEKLMDDREWITDEGDRLVARRGDYWVTSEPGHRQHGVARSRFAQLYRAGAHPGIYERIGEVTAIQAQHPTLVETLEGPARVSPGMWIVTGPGGESWPVSDERFREAYQPLCG